MPRTYREAVDSALQIERDWKDVDEERQQKRQAFQQKDQRPFKKQNKNKQRPQEQKPLPIQPISSVPAGNNRLECPKCHKNHPGQCRLGQNVCYKCGMPGRILKYCPKSKQLVSGPVLITQDNSTIKHIITEAVSNHSNDVASHHSDWFLKPASSNHSKRNYCQQIQRVTPTSSLLIQNPPAESYSTVDPRGLPKFARTGV
ncbi:hypothetical protein F511_18944 [Dorcoceras hygrometricum]|uniref:CCHC-type domain-containing protein n=1 Tax=Dorcoceras hygrometricum TaxID=472368 RepID=A0A2Z7B1P4_9LAMI|nr:hypothetical protein F511_18944 [Dorcoceras hygrometricum]